MTVEELFSYIDDVRPNAFTDGQKLIWLNELEARIQKEVFLSGELWQYRLPEDADTVLLLDPPHDAVYRHWMAAMIDYENGEYSKYQNTMQMFNAQWAQFVCWFAEKYRPADGYRRPQAARAVVVSGKAADGTVVGQSPMTSPDNDASQASRKEVP